MESSIKFSPLQLLSILFSYLIYYVQTYQVLISDTDDVRQVCSGMWQKIAKSRDPYIEILFGPASSGQLALVVYEWEDGKWLGIDESNRQAENNWDTNRTYVCTLDAISKSLCSHDKLGEFIISTLPSNVKRESLSIWTQSIKLQPKPRLDDTTGKPGEMAVGPFRYNVTKTGYYCVGAVPLTLGLPTMSNSSFSSYTGVVAFENVFKGNLPAGEYPKVAFYAFITLVYLFLGILWGINCHRHRAEILPVQHYISASIVFLVIELATVSGYYKYVNDFGDPTTTNALLVLTSILSAARNAMSFFMLLIVSLGYSIVKDSLGPVMLKVRLLAIAHFFFGVLYAIGLAVFPLEKAGMWIFLMVFPLAFTLTGFMMWIMGALSHTIENLEARKQTYKKQMFVKLYRILIGAAMVIVIFFFVSSVSFSNRLQQDFAPVTWRTRWFLLDGWLALLYMACFVSIAYLWRPTTRNKYLAMSEEIAQDEEAADEYENQRSDRARREFGDDEDGVKDWVSPEDGGDAVPLQLRRVGEETVVFDIGDDDDDEPIESGGRRGKKLDSTTPVSSHSRDPEESNNLLRRSNSAERPPEYSS
ncbi:hypothetical protein O181_056179 [Austropuccinia psidii MF-1]|uniref:Uncharacterized protein n=1 Tax=Austropuccinia psidii MF-1 TaxID=1389203 RepID=A0A9Q3E7Z5_9BASI|nr:hypothetical protein [Austropuccinia psidii MF-1]